MASGQGVSTPGGTPWCAGGSTVTGSWLGAAVALGDRAEIEAVAGDLCTGFDDSDLWWTRYPGW
jgi:hypothetical protein